MALARPIFSLLAFFIAYSAALQLHIGPAKISAPYLLAAAGMAFILIGKFTFGPRESDSKIRLNRSAVIFVIVYALASLWAILSLQLTDRPYSSKVLFSIIEQNGRLIACLILMAFVSTVVTRGGDLMKALRIISWSAGLVGAYGIYQVAGTFMGFYRPLLPNTVSYGVAEGAVGSTRANSVMGEPSYLAGYLVFSIIVTIVLLSESGLFTGRFRRILYISLGLQVLCMILTTSTIGFAGFAVGMIVLLSLGKRRIRRQVIIASVIIAILVSAPLAYLLSSSSLGANLISATIQKTAGGSAISRLEMTRVALSMFGDHVIIGVGPGCYDSLFRHYSIVYDSKNAIIANNVYAELLAETGIVGFAAFAFLLYRMWVLAYRRWVLTGRREPTALILLVSLATICVEFLAYPTFKMEFIWFIFGMIAAPIAMEQKETYENRI